MKSSPLLTILMLSAALAFSAWALTSAGISAAPAPAAAAPLAIPDSIPLWPNGAPGSEGHTAPEVITMRTDPATKFSPARTVPIITSINNPSITPFLPPAGKATGAALIIAPGGGHSHLSVQHEGYDVARNLSARGITCYVLKYRLSKEPNTPYTMEKHSLMDDQRALRYVRAHATEWNLDPHRIGIMGFSAGGQISLLAVTTYDKPVAGSDDAIDKIDCRPDFAALIYPGGLTNPAAIPILKDMPPIFLADAHGDPISRNMAIFYTNLLAAGKSAELHIYAEGSEGFGMRPSTLPVSTWPDRFVDWMAEEGFSKQK